MIEFLGDAENHFMAIAPSSPLARSCKPDRVLSMSQIELNSVLMLNLIVWNWTDFFFI